jgi:hypothetical protein
MTWNGTKSVEGDNPFVSNELIQFDIFLTVKGIHADIKFLNQPKDTFTFI